MLATVIGLLLRHLLTGVGAVLVTKGLSEPDASTIMGAVTIVGGLIWSWFQKRQAANTVPPQ